MRRPPNTSEALPVQAARKLDPERSRMHGKSKGPGPLRIGDTYLNKYEIRALIGAGGTAHVYHAHDAFLGRDVALKIVHDENGGGLTKEQLYRGQREARILIGLKHPNIVEVFDAGIDGKFLYMTMELLDGRNLRQVLVEQRRLEIVEALEMFTQIASAMAHAHAKGAIHRDLKPDNVVIRPHNTVKVIDFGIGKMRNEDAFRTQRNLVVGTPAYFTPEQVQGESATDKSDVYALGLMMFEALLGRHMCWLEYQPRSFEVFAYIHAYYKPRRLDEYDPSIPKYIARIVHRALSKVPDQRFSMGELENEIRSCLGRYREDFAQRGDQVARRDLSRPQPVYLQLVPAVAACPAMPSDLKGTHGSPSFEESSKYDSNADRKQGTPGDKSSKLDESAKLDPRRATDGQDTAPMGSQPFVPSFTPVASSPYSLNPEWQLEPPQAPPEAPASRVVDRVRAEEAQQRPFEPPRASVENAQPVSARNPIAVAERDVGQGIERGSGDREVYPSQQRRTVRATPENIAAHQAAQSVRASNHLPSPGAAAIEQTPSRRASGLPSQGHARTAPRSSTQTRSRTGIIDSIVAYFSDTPSPMTTAVPRSSNSAKPRGQSHAFDKTGLRNMVIAGVITGGLATVVLNALGLFRSSENQIDTPAEAKSEQTSTTEANNPTAQLPVNQNPPSGPRPRLPAEQAERQASTTTTPPSSAPPEQAPAAATATPTPATTGQSEPPAVGVAAAAEPPPPRSTTKAAPRRKDPVLERLEQSMRQVEEDFKKENVQRQKQRSPKDEDSLPFPDKSPF
jgi:serine/threonine protein kinase